MNKLLLLGFLGFISVLTLSGCGVTTGSAGLVSRSYTGTATPGDVWSYTLNYATKTFTARTDNGTPTNTADDLSFSGSFSIQPSGFLKLTVTGTSNATLVPIGAIAHALEAPGLVFIVQPENSGSEENHVITMFPVGTCGGASGNFNWIRTGFGGASYDVTAGAAEAYGTVSMANSGGNITPTVSTYNIGGTLTGTQVVPAGTCASGQLTFSDNTRGQVSASGGFMLDFGNNQGGVVGFKQNGLSLADVGNKTYAGLLFKFITAGDTITPVQAQLSNNSGTGYAFSNVDTGAVDPAQSTPITLSTITNGLVRGTVGGNQMSAATYNLEGMTVMFMISKDGGTTEPYNVLLIAR